MPYSMSRRISTMTTGSGQGAGREAQRRRTRRAIVDATIGLVADGATPTIAEVAEAADVSRRTIYMYFPSLEHLLVDATLGALSQQDVDLAIEDADSGGDPSARLEALVRSVQSMSPEVERLGRTLIRLTVDDPSPQALDGERPGRGNRRVEWIEAALAAMRDKTSPEDFDRLVRAVAVTVGWEAIIVQRDVCGLTAAQGEELSVWMAQTLLEATLANAEKDRH
jgi:AcrR family transcriptional regulator